MGAFFISSIFSLLFVYLVKFWLESHFLFSTTIQNERQDELVSVKKGHEQDKLRTKTQPNGTFSFFKLVKVNA